MVRRQEQFDQAQDRLNTLTLEYIQTTLGVSNGDARPLTDDQQLLAYAADANPQDAVLVYTSARSIMNDQTRRLTDLREAAEVANSLRLQVSELVASRQQATSTRRAAATEAQQLVSEQQTELAKSKKLLRRLTRMQSRYAAQYEQNTGEAGSLEDSPFAEAIYGNIEWEGQFRWPVNAPVTSPMGPRWGRMHEGIDLGASTGTVVRASASGVVSFAGENGGYGLLVVVRHGDGYETRYGHNSKLEVKAGDEVKTGKMLARSGNTGHSSGPHVHFEIRLDGNPLNPLDLLPRGDVKAP
jgi:murein DD-endopeptidase MepM/ murein hydrolase activator NlpD